MQTVVKLELSALPQIRIQRAIVITVRFELTGATQPNSPKAEIYINLRRLYSSIDRSESVPGVRIVLQTSKIRSHTHAGQRAIALDIGGRLDDKCQVKAVLHCPY